MDRKGREGDRKQVPEPGATRYDWPSLALFAIFLGAFIYALLRR